MYPKLLIVATFLVCNNLGFSQTIDQKIINLEKRRESLENEKLKINSGIEELKLERIRLNLVNIGLPQSNQNESIIWHSAYVLNYSEEFEQARWVAHIITPDVLTGTVFRSNDFRPDSLIKTGSAIEEDYFLKYLQPDSTYKYDGFGYDRGHLAPSADFRWSKKALSESYLYSNMSPQIADFNRGAWATIEDRVRGYLYSNNSSQLFVVSGPVLKHGLKKNRERTE